VKQFFLNRWFLFALVFLLAVGSWQWEFLLPLSEFKALRYAVVASVLFLMALPLEASVIRRTLMRPLAPALGIVINIGLLPLMAWGLSPLLQVDMAKGLLVAAATPCTLASASVWTRRAGGNDSTATLVTVVSSLLCFIVTPFWLSITLGKDFSATAANARVSALDPLYMTLQLALLVVLPMTVAQLLRLYAPLALWTSRHKVGLSTVAQFGILTMVLLGAIQTGAQLWKPKKVPPPGNGAAMSNPNPGGDARDPVSADGPSRPLVLDFAIMVAAVMGTHLAMFFVGLFGGRLLGLPREEYLAVAFAGSQKTLMVGLQVSMEIGASVLPMVVYHVGQLFVDTLLADWLRARAMKTRAKPHAEKGV
jgi:sodium/bile acid cotransporter 7